MPVNGQPTLIESVRNVITTYKGTVGDGMSLADITKIARVEPITLISSSLTGTKELYDVLHGILNIYTGYHLQAVQLLSTQLYDARILKILDKTNPDRDLKTFLAAGQVAFESDAPYASELSVGEAVRTLSLEGCEYKLPMLIKHRIAGESATTDNFGIDSEDFASPASALRASEMKIESFEKLGLTVGKVINVEFTTPGVYAGRPEKGKRPANVVSVPVIVKLDTMIIPSDTIAHLATANASEITMSARFQDVISGKIEFIKDYLLCSDLIKQQKKAMIKDSTGLYSQLLKRVNNSKVYSALSGNISMAGISAIYVMSEEDEAVVQRQIGGKLTNQKTREMVFNNTSAMMIAVIDRSWERCSLYIRDIDGFSQAPLSTFKRMSDKGNDNLGDILKAFATSTAPSF